MVVVIIEDGPVGRIIIIGTAAAGTVGGLDKIPLLPVDARARTGQLSLSLDEGGYYHIIGEILMLMGGEKGVVGVFPFFPFFCWVGGKKGNKNGENPGCQAELSRGVGAFQVWLQHSASRRKTFQRLRGGFQFSLTVPNFLLELCERSSGCDRGHKLGMKND